MKRNKLNTRDELLDIIKTYHIMILRHGKEFPAVVIDDIEKSILHVLQNNGVHTDVYTPDHNKMNHNDIWAAWKNGEIKVYQLMQYQTRHNGYFTENGHFIKN